MCIRDRAKFGTQTYQDDDLLCGEGVGYGEFTNGAEVPGLAVEDVIAADYEDNGDDELVYLTILGTGRVSGYPVNQKDIFAITYLYPSIWQRLVWHCLLYTSPSPRDRTRSRMPSSA